MAEMIITTYSSRKIMSLGILKIPLDQVLNISYLEVAHLENTK